MKKRSKYYIDDNEVLISLSMHNTLNSTMINSKPEIGISGRLVVAQSESSINEVLKGVLLMDIH